MTVKAHSPEQKPSLPCSTLASHELTFMSHSIYATHLGSAIPHNEVRKILETINKHRRISKLPRTKNFDHHKFLDLKCSWFHNV